MNDINILQYFRPIFIKYSDNLQIDENNEDSRIRGFKGPSVGFSYQLLAMNIGPNNISSFTC